MDMRRKGYFAQLQVSGIANPINFEGSILEIHQASLQPPCLLAFYQFVSICMKM